MASGNLIANRDPFHSSKHQLILSTRLAIVAMSRSIRQFLKRRSSFVATFVVPPKADIHAHKMAAKYLLIQAFAGDMPS